MTTFDRGEGIYSFVAKIGINIDQLYNIHPNLKSAFRLCRALHFIKNSEVFDCRPNWLAQFPLNADLNLCPYMRHGPRGGCDIVDLMAGICGKGGTRRTKPPDAESAV